MADVVARDEKFVRQHETREKGQKVTKRRAALSYC